MSPSRALLGLATATVLLATIGGAAPGLAQAPAAASDYTITVDPAATGPEIADSLYGVFFEDINFAADGGLYAELVRNRSFEFLPADNQAYHGLTAWTPGAEAGGSGTASTVTTVPLVTISDSFGAYRSISSSRIWASLAASMSSVSPVWEHETR